MSLREKIAAEIKANCSGANDWEADGAALAILKTIVESEMNDRGRILTEGYVRKGGINPQGSFDRRPPAPSAMKPLEDEIISLRNQVETLRHAVKVVHKDCLDRAQFSRDGKTVPIGDGAWMTLDHALEATK